MTGLSEDPRRPDRGRRVAVPTVAIALAAALVILLGLPLTSLGSSQPSLKGGLTSALKSATTSVQTSVQKLSTQRTRSGTVARTPAVSVPSVSPSQSSPSYTPPAYGSNPHGQGTVGSISVNPSSTRPYTYAFGGSSGQGEQVVIGRGRSEQQSNGTYDAHTTIAALFGNELLGVNANQGESNTGPLNPVQTAILNGICMSTSDAICLTVLAADTSAGPSGANTAFETAGVRSKQIAGLQANAASSKSSIQTNGSCQTSEGDSQVLGVVTSSGQVASAATSKETSTACSGQAPSQTGSSSVVQLGGTGVPIPAPGCANGTPNTNSGIPTLLPIICNADDMTQVVAPFGVREALTVLGLQTGTGALLRTATAASESHAVAPPISCSDSDSDCGKGETCVNGKDPDSDGDCSGNKCTDADHDCGIGPNGQPEACVAGKDPDGDGDCTTVSPPIGQKKCADADHDCGIGPNGQPEICQQGADPDGDSDCTACTDTDHDCGKLPSGASEVCVNATDPDADADCVSQVAAATLPFTGENILEVVLVGLVLTGGGLALANRLGTPSRRRK